MNRSSFSRSVKDELARGALPEESGVRQAELTGFLYTAGSVNLREDERSLQFVSTHLPTVRRIFRLWQKSFDIRPSVLVARKANLYRRDSYMVRITLDAEARQAVSRMGVWSHGRIRLKPPRDHLGAGAEERRAYLRASFLGGGSISDPSSGYHVEIHCRSEANAAFIRSLLGGFAIRAQLMPEDSGMLLYIKDAESISDFLKAAGAVQSMFHFEDVRIVKDLRNRVNRLVNSETANMTKVVSAAVRHMSDIRRLTPEMKDRLSPRTRELMWLRLSNPEASLRELGAMLDPPVSKSTVDYHFRKVRQLVSED